MKTKMKLFNNHESRITNCKSLIAILLLMLAVWQGGARAQVNYSVTGSFEPEVTGGDAAFTITRNGSDLPDQIVNFRAVSLSAVSDEHYPAEGYALHFAEGECSKQVHVWARYATPGTAFAYQTAPRSFRLVVYDMNGFELAHCDQEIIYGDHHNVPSDIYEERDIVVDSGMTAVTDAGYASNPYLLMWSSRYYNNDAIKPYLSITNAKLNMRLTFEAKEVHDGYQYIQLLFDEAISCDNRSGCSNGDPGNINISNYMAGFSHYQPGVCTDWYQ